MERFGSKHLIIPASDMSVLLAVGLLSVIFDMIGGDSLDYPGNNVIYIMIYSESQ